MVLNIYGQPAWFLAWCERPPVFDLQIFRIQSEGFALVFEIDEDLAGPGAHRKLGFSVECDFADDIAGSRVYNGRIVVASVECKDTLGRRIKKDRVGVLANAFYFADERQGFEIEYADARF